MPDIITRVVYYTADLIIPDGSDTGVYGDPCEEGEGAELRSGWYDPDWCRTEVYDERDGCRPDVWDGEVDPAVWLAHTLNDRLHGWPNDNGDGTWYSGESDTPDYRSGIDVSVAAHAEGFTDAELSQAEDWLQFVRRGGYLTLNSIYHQF